MLGAGLTLALGWPPACLFGSVRALQSCGAWTMRRPGVMALRVRSEVVQTTAAVVLWALLALALAC